MKKVLCLIFTSLIMLSMCACSNSTIEPQATEPRITYHKLGETVKTDSLEFTLVDCSFGDSIELVESGKDYKTIQDYPLSGVTAPAGKTYISLSAKIVNCGKKEVQFYDYIDGNREYYGSITADYNNGYEFTDDEVSWSYYYPETTSYDLSFRPKYWRELESIESLSSINKMSRGELDEAHCYFEVPDEVASNTSAPLIIKFDLPNCDGGTDTIYYQIR